MNTWRTLRRSGLGWTLLAALIVVAYLFPVYWMVATSLKSSSAVFETPPQLIPWPPNFSSYYVAVLNNPLALRSILNSAIVGTGTMIFTLLLAAPAAYALARLSLRGATLDHAAAVAHTVAAGYRHCDAALCRLQPHRADQLLPSVDPGRHHLHAALSP
jgi:ABC-type glycerol-3-phosphate transport system permease component